MAGPEFSQFDAEVPGGVKEEYGESGTEARSTLSDNVGTVLFEDVQDYDYATAILVQGIANKFRDYVKFEGGRLVRIAHSSAMSDKERVEFNEALLRVNRNLFEKHITELIEFVPEEMQSFFEGTKSLLQGDIINAQSAFESVVGNPELDPEVREFALSQLKEIAKINLANGRAVLMRLVNDVRTASSGYLGKSGVGGFTKNEGLRLTAVQCRFFDLVEAVIDGDNDVKSFEEAVKIVADAKDAPNVEDYFRKFGIADSDYRLDELLEGKGWELPGALAGSTLDAIGESIHLATGSTRTPEVLLSKFKQYREDGAVELATTVFDEMFKDQYGVIADKVGGREKFLRDHNGEIDKLVAEHGGNRDLAANALWKHFLRKELVTHPPDEIAAAMKAERLDKAINSPVVVAFKKSIGGGEDSKNQGNTEMLASAIIAFDDMLELSAEDKPWYDPGAWGKTDREWVAFMEELPAEVAVLFASGGAASFAGAAAKRGLMSAMKVGGRRGAEEFIEATLAQEIKARAGAFAVESLVFSEARGILTALRTGTLDQLCAKDLQNHLKDWAHTAVTFGAVKGVMRSIKRLPEGAAITERIAREAKVAGGDVIALGLTEYYWQSLIEGNQMSGRAIASMTFDNLVLGRVLRGVERVKEKALGIDQVSGLARSQLEAIAKRMKSSPEAVLAELTRLSQLPVFRKIQTLMERFSNGEIDLAAYQKALATLAPLALTACDGPIGKAISGLWEIPVAFWSTFGVTGSVLGYFLLGPGVREYRARQRVRAGGTRTRSGKGLLDFLRNTRADDQQAAREFRASIHAEVSGILTKLENVVNSAPDSAAKSNLSAAIDRIKARRDQSPEAFGLMSLDSGKLSKLKSTSEADMLADLANIATLAKKFSSETNLGPTGREAVASSVKRLIGAVGLLALGYTIDALSEDEASKDNTLQGAPETAPPLPDVGTNPPGAPEAAPETNEFGKIIRGLGGGGQKR